MFMNGSDTGTDSSGFAGMGRWFAVASEIPCSVVALLLVGQIVGTALLGPSGAITGALIGALLGFVLGVYGVFITINFYDKMEKTDAPRKQYMPPREEIFEDVKFDLDESKEID